jgi:hypothetical protein
VVAVPTRDWIVAANAGDAAAVTKLKDLAARVFRGKAYAVTPKLVKWDGKTWEEVPQLARDLILSPPPATNRGCRSAGTILGQRGRDIA